MFEDFIFIVQPYVAKPHRLVAQPAQIFAAEAEAKRAGARLARYRAGVVVMAQVAERTGTAPRRPQVLATYGRIPTEWTAAKAA